MIRFDQQFTRRPHRGPLLSFARRGLIATPLLAGLMAAAGPAAADFRICNTTGSLIGVAIGHHAEEEWTTDGWWNLEPNTCRSVLRGDLIARYYYVYAIDYELGGEWSGDSYMCTRDEMFTIIGLEDCEGRGYMSTGFFEVDTREQRSWTVRLTDPNLDGAGTQ